MSNKTKERLYAFLGFLLIAGAMYGGYLFLKYIGNLLLSLDKQFAATIIATSGTVLAAVGVAVYSQRRTKVREIAEAHRPIKIEVYKEWMETIGTVLKRTKDETADNSTEAFGKEFLDFFVGFTSNLIVWGSPGVLKAYENFRRGSVSEYEVLLIVDDMLREIRKDLGNSNRGIKRGDLIKLYLKDPAELDRKMIGK